MASPFGADLFLLVDGKKRLTVQLAIVETSKGDRDDDLRIERQPKRVGGPGSAQPCCNVEEGRGIGHEFTAIGRRFCPLSNRQDNPGRTGETLRHGLALVVLGKCSRADGKQGRVLLSGAKAFTRSVL